MLAVLGYAQTDSLSNPFWEKETNLPFWARMCGTGEPQRLTANDAMGALDSVFISEGLDIVKDRFIERGEAKYTATTFNEKYKIGYIWIERNLGAGMAKVIGKPWLGNPPKSFSDRKKDFQNTVKFDYKRLMKDSADYFISRKGMRTRINPTFFTLKSEKQKMAFFRKQRIDYERQELLHSIGRFDKDKNTIPKQWAFSPPNGIRPIEHLSILGLYWKIAIYSFNEQTKAALEKEIQAIMKYKRKGKWLRRSEKLMDLLTHANLKHLKANKDYQTAFLNVLNDQWRRRDLSPLRLISNYLTLDYFELGQIDKDNEDGALFVAPISYRDYRCVVQPSYVLPKPIITIDSLTIQEELAKMGNASPEEVERIYTRLYGKDKQKTPEEMHIEYQRQIDAAKSLVIERLENDVRRYIRWAKAKSSSRE